MADGKVGMLTESAIAESAAELAVRNASVEHTKAVVAALRVTGIANCRTALLCSAGK